MEKKRFFSAKNIAMLAVLLACVIVLQSVALVTGIFLPTMLSFVLIPIVLGAVLMGPVAGGILGFMFALMCIIFGATGLDGFTALLLGEHPVLTVLTCLLKGIAAGVVPGILYKIISKKNRYAAIVVASLLAPIMNTGIFILGAMTMWGTFQSLAEATGVSVMYFIIITCAIINFSIEFASTLIAAPSIYRVIEVVSDKKSNKNIVPTESEGAPNDSENGQAPASKTSGESDILKNKS